jgi:hypothetical protein
VPVALQVGLILSVLAADDPGSGFYTGQQAESGVLVENAQVGAGGSVVVTAQVIVDFQVGGSHGKSLGATEQFPASACTAFQVGGKNPVGFRICPAASETYLPGQGREELVAGRQRADFHPSQAFDLQFIIVGV